MTLAERYAIYRAVKAEQTYHPMLPASVKQIAYEVKRRLHPEARTVLHMGDLDLREVRHSRSFKQAGDLTLNPDYVRSLGFDPEYLTCRVELISDEFFEGPLDDLTNSGLELTDVPRDWEHHEDESRPSHTAVKLDTGDRRERYKWVDVKPRDRGDFYAGNAYKGLSRSWKAQAAQERVKYANETSVEWARAKLNDDVAPYTVTVRLYWRNEEIADTSLGSIELGYPSGRRYPYKSTDTMVLEDAVDGNGLLAEVLDYAVKWADGAVAEAQAQAAKIVSDIALLPERSIAAVRDSFATATVLKLRA